MAEVKPLKLTDLGAGAGRLEEFGPDDKVPSSALPEISKEAIGLGNADNTSDVDKPVSTATQTALDGKLDKTANAVSASKLATARTIALGGDLSGSVSFNGTANVTIAATVADDSHNHVIGNVDGLQGALDSKVDKATGQSLMTDAERSKLGGIEAGATANATDAQLRDRATHTGTQAVGTITGLGTAATADVQTSPTDTTAGALMAVGAFGLGGLAYLEDKDVWINNRFKAWGNGTGYTGPSSTVSVGMDLGYAPTRRGQLAITMGNALFFRGVQVDPQDSTGWREVFHKSNILGTVSQSGGVPTGAIIERGSNANGEYTKFADGTQICSVNGTTGTAGSKEFTLPAAFITATFAVAGIVTLASASDVTYKRASNTASSYVFIFTSNGAYVATDVAFSFLAIGRWF